jgi:hypothetical protein
MKWVLLFIQLIIFSSLSGILINIGADSILTVPLPLNADSDYSYSQIIYLQQEIQHFGLITELCYHYHIVSNSFINCENQLKIYMGHTNKTSFESTIDWISVDSLELVFDGNWDVSNFSSGNPGDGWVTIQLTNGFAYNNINNLIIAFDENQPDNTVISDKFHCSPSISTRSLEYHANGINPDPSAPPAASNFNPRFFIANICLEMMTDFPPPVNPYPANSAESVELLPQFTWSCDADSYDLFLGLQPEQLAVQAASLTAENWSPTSLLQTNTTYWWQVKAHYGQQMADSPIWHFTTGNIIGNSIPFQESFDLNVFPPNQWLRLEGLYQPNAVLTETIHGWNWDYFDNETNLVNGAANLNIYGRDCYYWLISPSLSGAVGTQVRIKFLADITNWNTTSTGQLGEDDKIRLVLFTGINPILSSSLILREWTSSDSPTANNDIPLTLPAGIFRLGFYGESTISNEDCDLFIDDFRIVSENSLQIEAPGELTAQVVGTTIQLQWIAPPTYTSMGYRIYRNNRLLCTSIQPGYVDTSVNPGQNYSYFVTALNENGMESLPSASASLFCTFTSEPLFYDSFESYIPFSQVSTPWMNLDLDLHDTFGLPNTSFPNETDPSSFMVFRPEDCEPPFTSLEGSEGQQYLAAFPDSPPPNNDWLITPHLHLGTSSMLSFKARSLSIDYGAERFRIGISTTSATPDSFHMISNEPYVQAPEQWTEFMYNLSPYDGQDIYIAIQCVSYDCCMFALDEFKVITEGGYVGNTEQTIPQPLMKLSAYPNPFHDQCKIMLYNPVKERKSVEIYNIRGQRVFQLPVLKSDIDVAWDGKDSKQKPVAPGVYIVRVKGEHGVVCRKVVKY